MNRRYDLGYVANRLTHDYGYMMMLIVAITIMILYCYRTAGEEVRRACDFLLSKQMEDGGWGEDFAVSYDYYTAMHTL